MRITQNGETLFNINHLNIPCPNLNCDYIRAYQGGDDRTCPQCGGLFSDKQWGDSFLDSIESQVNVHLYKEKKRTELNDGVWK